MRTLVVEVVAVPVDLQEIIPAEVSTQLTRDIRRDPSSLDTSLRRKLLNQVLRSDSDVDAFSLDCFPTVYERFSMGIERTYKLRLLLSNVSGAELLAQGTIFRGDEFVERICGSRACLNTLLPRDVIEDRSPYLSFACRRSPSNTQISSILVHIGLYRCGRWCPTPPDGKTDHWTRPWGKGPRADAAAPRPGRCLAHQ